MFGPTSSFTHRELMDPMSVMRMDRQMGALALNDGVDLSKAVDLGTSIMAVEFDGVKQARVFEPAPEEMYVWTL